MVRTASGATAMFPKREHADQTSNSKIFPQTAIKHDKALPNASKSIKHPDPPTTGRYALPLCLDCIPVPLAKTSVKI